jgi:hypothetical protein
MFLRIIEVTPTSSVTFRKVPLSHKIIRSYSFVPPTTLSGFLYRILKLVKGEEIPQPGTFSSGKPNIGEYYILETKEDTKDIYSLGGYPMYSKASTFGSFRTGYQHAGKGYSTADGLRIFDPSYEDLIQLITEKIEENQLKKEDLDKFKNEFQESGENHYYLRSVYKAVRMGYKGITTLNTFNKEKRRQPLDWYFCVAEKFNGFLISKKMENLAVFDHITNYGFKIGKEGFAFVSGISTILEMAEKEGVFNSSVIIPLDPAIEHTIVREARDPESVYYFSRHGQQFTREIFGQHNSIAEGVYYTDKNSEWNIPLSTLEKLEVLDE